MMIMYHAPILHPRDDTLCISDETQLLETEKLFLN